MIGEDEKEEDAKGTVPEFREDTGTFEIHDRLEEFATLRIVQLRHHHVVNIRISKTEKVTHKQSILKLNNQIFRCKYNTSDLFNKIKLQKI